MFCDPERLTTEPSPDRRGQGVQLVGPGLRSGSAAGVSQAIGAPLKIGATLKISGAAHVSGKSVLFVSGQGVAAGPDLWPSPSLKVGFSVGHLAEGRATVTFARSGDGLKATLRDGSGKIIQPGYTDAVVAPPGGPQLLFAYFSGLVAVEDNPRYQDCTVEVVAGKVTALPADADCKALQRAINTMAKQRVTIHGSTATIQLPTTYRAIEHFRKVAGRWYLVTQN
jgi:hypothetical protein